MIKECCYYVDYYVTTWRLVLIIDYWIVIIIINRDIKMIINYWIVIIIMK